VKLTAQTLRGSFLMLGVGVAVAICSAIMCFWIQGILVQEFNHSGWESSSTDRLTILNVPKVALYCQNAFILPRFFWIVISTLQ
jgi:hypothetical protein